MRSIRRTFPFPPLPSFSHTKTPPPMLDELKEEHIVNKVGGRFKLSTLIQKRLVQLNRGVRPLVEYEGSKPGMETVIKEILEDKIYLDASHDVVEVIDDAPDLATLDGGPSLDDL